MRRSQRNLLLALALVVAVFVGRYVLAFPHAATTITTTVSAPTSTTSPGVSSTTTVPPSTSSTTTTTASLTTCRGAQFTGANVGSEGAAGTGYDIMSLTKISGAACVVDGYPVITLVNSAGHVDTFSLSDSTNFPTAPANAAPVAHTVVIGQKIDVQLRYSDIGSGTQACMSVARANLQFIAGDAAVPISFAYPIAPCQSVIGVSGFYPA